MTYPVQTVGGETVMIVEKRSESGADPHDTTVLVAEDGRLFQPSSNGLKVVEISAAAENAAAEAASEQEDVTEPDLSETAPEDETEAEPAA